MKPRKRERPAGHDVRLEIGAGYSGPGYWFAECRCGWGGSPRLDKSDAKSDATQHLATQPQEGEKR